MPKTWEEHKKTNCVLINSKYFELENQSLFITSFYQEKSFPNFFEQCITIYQKKN